MASINTDNIVLTQEHQTAITAIIWVWFLQTHHPHIWQVLNKAVDSAIAVKGWMTNLPGKIIDAIIISRALDLLPDFPF